MTQFKALEQTRNWKCTRADELFEIGIGKTPPRKESEWFSSNQVGNFVWLSIKDMGELGAYSFDSSEYLTPQAVKDKKIRRAPKGSVLLSFKLTVGRVKIAAVDMTTNEAIAFFASNDPAKLAYLYPFLLTFDYGRLGSTSSIATAINSKTVKAMTITMPDDHTLARFYANVKPLYETIMSNQRENAFLKSLRDNLLPMLMSGEIDASKVDLMQLNSHLSDHSVAIREINNSTIAETTFINRFIALRMLFEKLSHGIRHAFDILG
ncbi:restriction endonuclease subunit S [Senegalimassilia faecalis]|uniref:restriction endonuclease subunit S n=1 Tax=Senegalimassilia faecalis TaxID=2509433 RepID=UPI003A977778